MADLDLFGSEGGAAGRGSGPPDPPDDDRTEGSAPLAARMRPRSLAEFRGQQHLLGEGRAIRAMLDAGRPASMILWGPPGSGKTTLARIIAREAGLAFVPVSAVTDGIARVRQVIAEAEERLRATRRRTVLFCDEIHRFNKAQQDGLLPHVESGTVTLIGATTENPSFEVVRPLLSRAPVYVLEPLAPEEIRGIVEDALADVERGLGGQGVSLTDEALDFLSLAADGDARRALGVLEAAARLVGSGREIGLEQAREALQHRFATYDKGGEEHFNVISALHKSVRGSDPDAALYWLARMIDGGEDPLYIARRMVRMAAEDIGLADPQALAFTIAARDAYQFLGSPEGDLALAEAAVYLATAPKSNRVYEAWSQALRSARDTPGAPVPLHIRNAPTSLMKDLGYGAGYQYDPAAEHGVADQRYLPDAVGNARFYEPGQFGFEKTVRERLEWWARHRHGGSPRAEESTTSSPGDVTPRGSSGEPA